MMSHRLPRGLGAACIVVVALASGACDETVSQPTSALRLPIDFAYACQADGGMQAPDNDETAATFDSTQMCPDVGGEEGELWGVALDRQPPGLVVLQMNPAAIASRGFIDADLFAPGVSPIPVGDQPVGVVASQDRGAFFVLSAGDQRLDRVVITGHDADGLQYEVTPIPLPGVPEVAITVGGLLVVASRDAAELYLVPTAPTGRPLVSTVALPEGHVVVQMEPIPGDADGFIATFRDRPTVARVSLAGVITAEAGLVAACRDGLDNDDDGVADRQDDDCLGWEDTDEGDTGAKRPADVTVVASWAGTAPCEDGLDNDLDGASDGADGACAAGGSELLPGCGDGVDNDADGLVDGDDSGCYGTLAAIEGQLPLDGPFHPAFVDALDAGRFVYVLDERTGRVAVFAYDAGALTRVDVHAEDATPPALESVPFGDPAAEPREDLAIPAIRQPALWRRGVKDIEILEGNAFSLSSSRLRGELWERIITPAAPGEPATVSFTPNDAEWKPSRCAVGRTDACAQPAGDDTTWLLFGANLDGRMQMIEAVRRGVPVHRLAQREDDPSDRGMDVSAPRLTVRGRLINARGEPQEGYPFLGAAIEELVVVADVGVSPSELRRFGIWPPEEIEEAPSETWTITYEGRIPEARGALGRISAQNDATSTLFDGERAFCDEGVAVGDLVQISAPVAAIDPRLQHDVPVVLEDGSECPVIAPETALIEARVVSVGMSTLVVDRASARLRPLLPVLDPEAIVAARLSLRACEQALDDLDQVLGRPEHLAATSAFGAAALPARFNYEVRVGARWSVVGTKSGFLHRQRWDGTTCVVDDTLDTRFAARIDERTAALGAYAQCPPPAEQLAQDAVEALAPAASRFANPSFAVDVFPGCERDAEGAIVAAPSQQDTTFQFTVTGPNQGSALSLSEPILMTKVPMLDFRRQQIQLDTSARRASILQMRLGNPKVIVTFE